MSPSTLVLFSGSLGAAFHRLGDFRKAKSYHELHLNISREVKDIVGEGAALSNRDTVLKDHGDLEKAMDYRSLYFDIAAKDVGDNSGKTLAYSNLDNAGFQQYR